MTWTGWDIAIVVVGGLTLAALLAVVVALRGLLHTLADTRPPIAGVAEQGQQLARASVRVTRRTQGRVRNLAHLAHGLRDALHLDLDGPPGMPINWRVLLRTIGQIQGARLGWAQVRGLWHLRGATNTTASTAAPAPARGRGVRAALSPLTWADRLGLIPPAARHLPTLLQAVRVARSVVQATRRD